MKKIVGLGAVVSGCLFFFACHSTHQDQQVKSQVDTLIDQSIATHGGASRWRDIQEISYSKSFALFDSTGGIESEVVQGHTYKYGADPLIHIQWQTDGYQHDIYERHGYYSKTINAEPDTNSSQEQLRNAVNSSLYVHGIPYKLKDPGPVITYEGSAPIWTGEVCDVIKVVYDPTEADNLTTPDTWWYYLAKGDARVRAAKVKHLDHISGIRNISYQQVDGFLFNHERESYRLDADGNVLYLRAKYVYDNYELTTR